MMQRRTANSTEEDNEAAPKKKRKATYLVRKEEADALRDQIRKLRAEAAALQEQNGGVHTLVSRGLQLQEARGKNVLLQDLLRAQNHMVATTQSMMSECSQRQAENPMYTHIHLPKAWSDRRQVLMAMKDQKLLRGYEYLNARSHHLNLLKPHLSEERYDTPNGDYECARFEIVQFPGVKSLKQVFDALVYYFFNMEISISEHLGEITLREDDGSIDMGTDQYMSTNRLVSKDENGVNLEFNAVAFEQYFDGHEAFGGRPCAVMTTDSVDEDDLHPYSPKDRVRKDLSASIVLTEERRSKKTGALRPVERSGHGSDSSGHEGETAYLDQEEEEEVVVVMRRAGFSTVRRPQFELSAVAMEKLRDGIADWCDVMLQSVRSTLYSQSP